MHHYLKALDGLFMPERIRALPIDERGYPVPWFAHRTATGWDFRVVGVGKVHDAVSKRLCWICGQRLGRHLAFAIGPTSCVTRIAFEPPSHRDCAEFAVQACPFLVNPGMRRNERNLPEGAVEPPGRFVADNPGVTAIWLTTGYRTIGDGPCSLDAPKEIAWYAHGRRASPGEASAALEASISRLIESAEQQPGLRRLAALRDVFDLAADARRYLPMMAPA